MELNKKCVGARIRREVGFHGTHRRVLRQREGSALVASSADRAACIRIAANLNRPRLSRSLFLSCSISILRLRVAAIGY